MAFRLDGDGGTESAHGAARTDAAGAYRVEGFAADQWSDATAAKPGWYEAPHGRYGYRTRLAAGDARLDFVVARGGRVIGRVLTDGEPVAGAMVIAVGTNDGHDPAKRRAISDAQGRYVVDGLPPGRATLVVAAEGAFQEGFPRAWIDEIREGGSPEAALVDVRAGEEVTKDLVLARGIEISGRVLFGDGAPAAAAGVDLWFAGSPDTAAPLTERRTTTDAEGAFRFRGVVPGKALRLHAQAGDFGASLQPTVDPRDGARDLVLRLARAEPKCLIHVRVVWPDGTVPAKRPGSWARSATGSSPPATATTRSPVRRRTSCRPTGNSTCPSTIPRARRS